MDLAIYAHPWDLRALSAHGGLARLRDLGFGEVALAVSYHAGRWLTPWHPDGMVRFLEDGTVHYRPRGDYGPLQPKVSSEVRDGEPSPLEWLCAEAPKASLRARAWAVGTHNTRLGELHPECCVENAFGDRYSYALCPGNAHVQQYLLAMVQDLAAHAGLHAIELEGFGWMGHRHNSHHDKSSFVADVYSDVLLSACFCATCVGAMRQFNVEGHRGHDIDALRAQVAARLRRQFADGDAMGPTPGKLTREELMAQLRAEFGAPALAMLGNRVVAPVRAVMESANYCRTKRVRSCLQTNFDGLRGGSAMPLAMLGPMVTEAALTVYGEKVDGIAAALPHLVAARGEQTQPPTPRERWPSLRLCFHPKAPQFTSDDDLRKVKDLCAQHGVTAISIYHLGLLPWRTIERVATALRA